MPTSLKMITIYLKNLLFLNPNVKTFKMRKTILQLALNTPIKIITFFQVAKSFYQGSLSLEECNIFLPWKIIYIKEIYLFTLMPKLTKLYKNQTFCLYVNAYEDAATKFVRTMLQHSCWNSPALVGIPNTGNCKTIRVWQC